LFSVGEFLIVLKAANTPGFAAWLFDGPNAASSFGDWSVAWNKDLSHLSIYASHTSDEVSVPEPFGLALMVIGLLGLGVTRRSR
jgi:hypothetical protein